jgi:hypothetical protein
MKKAYQAPQLTNHGDVEKITLGEGSKTIYDFFVYGFTDPLGRPKLGSR